MLNYCKTCPDRYTEVCALPSTAKRITKGAAIIGALIFENSARTTAIMRPKHTEPDMTGMMINSLNTIDTTHVPAEACVWLHMQNTPEQA